MSDFGNLRRHAWALPLEFIMFCGVIGTFADKNWKHLLIALFTFGVSLLPLFVERVLRIHLSIFLQTVYVAFVFGSMFAGEVWGMYSRIWEWDDTIHLISGLLIGLGAVLGITLANYRHKSLHLVLWLQSLLVFCFVSTVSVVWEIVEFTSDQVFGTFSQGNDLPDTMTDLVFGIIGGLMVAILYALHLKKKQVPGFSRIILTFEKNNR